VTWLRHRTAVFLLAMAVLWGAWEAYLRLSASWRLGDDVTRALARQPLVNVAITLGFAPEEFHVRLFQTHGVVSGVRGTTVLLNRVPAEDVARIGRYYWVRRVALQ
jgi:hypothetical protein